MKYIIEGGKKLSGEIKISGNKNAILPCMAAALLTSKEVRLRNCPQISDVEVFIKILQRLGVRVLKSGDLISIKADTVLSGKLPDELTQKLRASILLIGPILSRLKRVEFCFPGGDVIGRRSINTHLLGFREIGVKVYQEDLRFIVEASSEKLRDKYIFMDEASVTATENLISASVVGEGQTTLQNCASEPHVIDLCNLLTLMGAKIEGVGTNTLIIHSVKVLSGADYRIGDDPIEIGTYGVASAITGSKLKLKCNPETNIDPIAVIFKKFGIRFSKLDDGFLVETGNLQSVDKIVTNIWPGFPTDLMSAVIVLATQSSGVTLCHDWMYESRMFFVDKLISMGAKITIADPHRVLVYGPTKLFGRNLETPDIRAGMALVLSSLVASGESKINNAQFIERGYEKAFMKLKGVGAKLKK